MSAAALPLISVVTPVYCCANCLRDLCARIGATVGTITEDYEIVLVDDASPDAAWPAIHDLCAHDARIKGIALSRNFGQHYAIAAGLEQVTGEWIVVMDCDLQDRPEEIEQLYAKEGRLRCCTRGPRSASGQLGQADLVAPVHRHAELPEWRKLRLSNRKLQHLPSPCRRCDPQHGRCLAFFSSHGALDRLSQNVDRCTARCASGRQ
jgi:glycosyltransferase involved in cell wall biosynthesis